MECAPVLSVGVPGAKKWMFDYPTGLALTPDERTLLVADERNSRIVLLRASDGEWLGVLGCPPGIIL